LDQLETQETMAVMAYPDHQAHLDPLDRQVLHSMNPTVTRTRKKDQDPADLLHDQTSFMPKWDQWDRVDHPALLDHRELRDMLDHEENRENQEHLVNWVAVDPQDPQACQEEMVKPEMTETQVQGEHQDHLVPEDNQASQDYQDQKDTGVSVD